MSLLEAELIILSSHEGLPGEQIEKGKPCSQVGMGFLSYFLFLPQE